MMNVARGLSGTALVVGLTVLAGWYLHLETLTSLVPGYATMKPNAALSLALLGAVSLARRRRTCLAGGALVAAMGAVTLGEYLLDRSLGVDHLLPGIDLGTDSARMAPATAGALFLLGTAVVAATGGGSRMMRAGVMAAFGIGFFAVLGYLYGVSTLYAVGGYTSMALPTAVCLCLISAALLLQEPDRGLVGLFRDRGAAGKLARWMFPSLLVGPAGLGWLRLWGEDAGWYDARFGAALLVSVMILLGGALTWRVALLLRDADGEREIARLALVEANRLLKREVLVGSTELTIAQGRLSVLVDSIPDFGLFGLDPDGRIESWNAGAHLLQGYSESEVLGQHFSMFHPEEQCASRQVEAELEVARATGRYEGEGWRIRKDGSRYWANVMITAVHDDDGRPRGFSNVTRDRTEQRESEAKFEGLLEAAPDAMLGIDADGVIQVVNTQAELLFGYPREELLGGRIEILIPHRARGAHPGHRRRYFADPQARPMGAGIDLSGRRKDGSEFPAEISLSSILTGEGLLITAAVRDVSERKALDAVVARSRDVAEAPARSRQDFLANMSHEIRTPMYAVIGMTSLVLDSQLDEQQRDYLEMVRTSGEHLLTIINDILDYAKIDAGKLMLEEIPFDVRDWLHATLDLVAAQAHERGLELTYDVEPAVPAVILGDPGRLRQILLNLLSNAIKFTESGEVVVLVGAENREAETWFQLSVRDTGIGMERDRLELLFEPFIQADSSTTRLYGGTGLGLAISRQLAQSMGGTLELESEPGEGTTATFRFEARPIEGSDAATSPAWWGDLVGLRVLVVDDNLTNRQILSAWISRYQVACVAVAGAVEALELVERGEHFDFAILDLMMPGMDGAQLGVELRARVPSLPLVLLSSAGPDAREIARDDTFAAVLSKPSSQERLVDTLARLARPDRRPLLSTGPEASPFERVGPRPPLSILVVEDAPVNQKVAQYLLARFGYRCEVVASGSEAIAALEHRNHPPDPEPMARASGPHRGHDRQRGSGGRALVP